MGNGIRSVLGGLGLTQVRHVRPVSPGSARGLVAAVYGEIERDFGVLAPPMALHSPAPESLAAAWTMLRATLVGRGAVSRPVKEAVATAVSRANACPFCVTVHSGTFRSVGGSDSDPQVRAAAEWAAGTATAATATACPLPGAAELVGLVVKMQYLNRMVTVFLPEAPLPPGAPAFALGPVMAVLGRHMRVAAARTPGPVSDLLPAADLPADMCWAGPDPAVADAFSRAAAVIDAGGEWSVPPAVRALVTAEVAAWTGGTRGPSRAWVDEATAGLSDADRPAGRLALLVALSPHQVDETVLRAFPAGDTALVELTSWAAFTAARRVGSWVPAVSRVTVRRT